MLFWHVVIKPTPRLTAYHLFTADFNFPDSLFPWNSHTVSPVSVTLTGFLSSFHSLTHPSTVIPAPPNPDCVAHPSVKVLTQLIPAPAYYHGMLSCNGFLFSAAQIHLFYHHSFLSIYSGLGGSRRIAGAFEQCCVWFAELSLGTESAETIFLSEFAATVNIPKRMVIYACWPFHPHLHSKLLLSEGKGVSRNSVPLTWTEHSLVRKQLEE